MTGPLPTRTVTPMPPDEPGPVHPGAPPVEPQFPFPEARAALQAIGTLLEQLRALSSTRDAATSTMLAASSGSSIDAFESRNGDLATGLTNSWGQRGSGLVMDQEWLRTAIADAETAHDAWVDDKASWQRRLDRHQDWVRDHPGVPPDQGPH